MADGWIDYACMHGWMDGWMDGWMVDGWMDGWMDGWWVGGWMDGQTDYKEKEVMNLNDSKVGVNGGS